MSTEELNSNSTSIAQPLDPPPPRRRRSWVRAIGRWALALVIIGGLAYGVYLLWPSIDERFVQPISNNSDGILTLTERVDELEVRIAELESRTAQIVEAERTNTTGGEAVDDRLARLQAELDAQQARLEGLEDTAFALADADEEAAARTEREITVLRAMALMSRARLSLYQANYGLAGEDLAAAQAVLGQITNPDDTIVGVLDRLAASAASLPSLPVPAAADLDIAWQLLLGDVAANTTTTSSQPTTTTDSSTSSTTSQTSEPEG
jgi:hypothetical protein